MKEHVDVVRLDWHAATATLIERIPPDDPSIPSHRWASYRDAWGPHTYAECPFKDEAVLYNQLTWTRVVDEEAIESLIKRSLDPGIQATAEEMWENEGGA